MEDEAERLRSAYEERARVLLAGIGARDLQLSILSEVASRIHGAENGPRILDIALETILRRMGLSAAWVFMGDLAERKLHLAASRGVAASYLEEIRCQGLGECLCPEVFWTGHRMQARNTTQCPRMPSIVEGLTAPVAHACIPLLFEGESRGVLNVAALPGQQFSDDELRFLETLGHQVCIALEKARLYERARQAYQELKAAQHRILQTEKMALLGTFAAGLAHEVRNPLNSIGLQLSILERRMGRIEVGLSKEIAELIGVIRGEIQRLDALVGDFLLFSQTNRVQYQLASLEDLADGVERLLRPEAGQSAVTLRRRHLGDPIPSLPMDAEKMKQVVINLARNAIEAMPGGGEVVIETSVVDGQARVAVRDDGAGLPEGVDVFQLFVTTKPKGTGLGLSIAQQIVVEHGGEITARSAPGRGTTFTVSLPLAPDRGAVVQGEVP